MTAQSPVAPARRLPMLLLVLLPLVLGGALLVIGLAPAASPDAGPPDITRTAAFAAAVSRGQGAAAETAGQASLARVLGASDPAPATLEKARATLGSLAASLGKDGSAVLVDTAGAPRLGRGAASGGAAAMLPGGVRDLARIFALRSGVLVQVGGRDGRTVVFSAPVRSPAGTIGAIIATVPARTLLGAGAPVPPAGAIAIGNADGTPWAAIGTVPGTSGMPLPRTILLLLAGLSLLALPLAWMAGRPRRARAGAGSAFVGSGGPQLHVAADPPATAGPRFVVSAATATAAPARRPPAYTLGASATPAALPAATSAVAAPATAAHQEVTPMPAAAVAPGSAAAAAEPVPARKGRFGFGRKQAGSIPAPALVDPPAPSLVATAAATPPDELVDALTGLGNHRGFGDELDRLMVAWQRTRVPFAVLIVDVDDLKITNVRAGHATGDEVLKALGRHVKGILRFSDRAFRIGGDEIAVLLPHTDAGGAVQLGQRLLARVRSGEGGEPALGFSAGAAAFPGPAQDRDQLMGQANAALAWGKSHGRGSVLAYDPVTHAGQTDAERVASAAAVAQVIAERSLRAAFQPIVDMASGEVVGFEGLTRPGPGAPFTNPGALFEAAEQVGRTVELDAACFETIVEGARAIPRDRVVTINLSPRTMEAADFSVEGVLAVLRAHDLDPGRVVLELTERESVLDLDRLRDNLAELQRAGVRIAADDVGAGNAGLRLLSQFRFDIVKVDLGLVQEGASNDASRAILRSLRDLAQRWGAFVIAEGIETPTQLRVVRELGLSAGQGFLIGRPGTLVDLPPVDLAGLEQGQLMLQNAPVPTAGVLHGSPA